MLRHSMRAKIMLLTMGLLSFFAVVLVAYMIPSVLRSAADHALEEAESVARTLRTAIVLQYWQEPARLQTFLEAQAHAQRQPLVGRTTIREEKGRDMAVVDRAGTILAHSEPERVGHPISEEDAVGVVGQTLADGISRSFAGRHPGGRHDQELVVPIEIDGARVGALVVQYYYEDAVAAAFRASGAAVGLAVVALLVACFLSYYLSRSITSRLGRLAGAAGALGRGDLSSRAAVTGRDEVAQLAATFDSMAESLQQREQELEFFFSALKTLAEADDLRQALGHLAQVISKTLHTPFCLVGLIDDDRQSATFEASYTEGHVEPSQFLGHQVPLAKLPTAQWVLDNREPVEVHVSDGANMSAFERSKWDKLPSKVNLVVPIVAKDVTIGMIVVGDEQERRFSEREKRLCAAVARQVAAAVENARLDQAARDERRNLQVIIDHLPAGVAVASAPDGEIVMANAAAVEIWGHPPVPGVGLDDHAAAYGFVFPTGEPYPVERLPLARAIRRGESETGAQFNLRTPNGQLATHLVSFSPLRNEAGHISAAVMVFQDVTRLREADRLREELVSTMSHDLRNPLMVISGNAQLLRRRMANTEREEEMRSVSAILTSAQRMDSMITNIVDSARLEMRGIQAPLRPLELHSVCTELCARMQTVPGWREVDLRMQGPSPHVLADEQLLERILVNLVGNALKYSPPGAPVALEVGSDGQTTVVAVTDQGPGVNPNDLPYIFERFYRSRESRHEQGLGLGLYISRLLVEGMGGRIWVESTPGSGSTFKFALPVVDPNTSPTTIRMLPNTPAL